jgi:glycerol-3-phosphate acyltransferase PlsY
MGAQASSFLPERPGAISTRLTSVKPIPVLATSFAAGSIPFTNIAAHRRAGVDLRDVGTGTVSGTSLFRVAGFAPLAVTGVADIAKATVGPLLAGRDRPVLAAAAGAAAIAGHNWSPWLRGAGGRGFAPSLGVLGVNAWPGVPVMLGGLVAGKAVRQTGLGGFVAQCALVPVLARTRGWRGALVGVGVVAPMWAKRLAGNAPPPVRTPAAYVHRLLFDCDRDQPAEAFDR